MERICTDALLLKVASHLLSPSHVRCQVEEWRHLEFAAHLEPPVGSAGFQVRFCPESPSCPWGTSVFLNSFFNKNPSHTFWKGELRKLSGASSGPGRRWEPTRRAL